MKLALVHDFLCGIGGSERVFQHLCEAFPKADVYSLAYRPEKTLPYFATREIKTTWLNPLIASAEAFRWSFPVATHVMQSVDLTGYDVVLSSSATTAKYVKTAKGRQLCYCYIPTRALWHYDQYFGKSWKRHMLKPFLDHLRQRDYAIAQDIGHFIGISEVSKGYIRKYYDREADVVYCPVETEKFTPGVRRSDYYLLVSRLEKWKRVDYAIEAFNQLGLPLRVVGTGAEEEDLRKRAKGNIAFMGSLDDKELARAYGECKAVVFTPFLEYGLIPLEANAAGAPVICYGRGGVEETMIPAGGASDRSPTAVFFYEQTPAALKEAVLHFENLSFDPKSLVRHAAAWSVAAFQEKMRSAVAQFAGRR